MKIKRRHRRTVPTLNTASLPDLIFTVLFFFLIVTHMRDNTVKVRYTTPEGTEISPIAKKSAVVYVYVGMREDRGERRVESGKATGRRASLGNERREESPVAIQVNDRIVPLDRVAEAVLYEKDKMLPEDQQQMMVSLRADRHVKMEIITGIKQALRQANVKRINYSATEKVSF